MAQQQSLIPNPKFSRSLLNLPLARFPSLWEGLEEELAEFTHQEQNGLTIYEDDKNVFIEAALPGLQSKDIEVTLDKGILWIRGANKEEKEDKEKKYYRKMTNSFSYRVTIPSQIDEKSEPHASYKDGILKLSFQKTNQSQTKKITVKNG